MLQGPYAFYEVSRLLVTNIDLALRSSLGGSTNRSCVVPGEVALDECECGMLSVSHRRFFLSDEFPEDAVSRGTTRTTPCDLPYLVGEFVVTIARCAPQPPDGQLAPSCAALDAAAQVFLSDAYVVLTETVRTLCELVSNDDIIDYVISDQVSKGPEGVCVGTELVVHVGVPR